jgi:hypothetical protein
MTGAEKIAINETLPDAINDEKVAREAAVKELKAKDTELLSAAVTLDEEIGKLSRNENELWYGVKFDLANSSSPDGVRTGNMEMHKTLPIQSKMRGCTINNVDNVKKYLKADDWTKWEDGTVIAQDSS